MNTSYQQTNKLQLKNGNNTESPQSLSGDMHKEIPASKMVVDATKHFPVTKQQIPTTPRKTSNSVDQENATQFHIFFTALMLSSTRVNATTSQGQDSDSQDEDSDSDDDSIVVKRRRRARRAESSPTERHGRRGYLREGRSYGWDAKHGWLWFSIVTNLKTSVERPAFTIIVNTRTTDTTEDQEDPEILMTRN